MMNESTVPTTLHLIDQEERATLDRRAAAFYNYPRKRKRHTARSVQPPDAHNHNHHAWNVIEACAALVSDPLTPPRQSSSFKRTSLSPCSSATALGDLVTSATNSKAIWRQDFVQWAFDTLHTLLLQDQDDVDDTSILWRIQVLVETCMAVLDKYSSLIRENDNDDDETTWALQGLTCLWMACKTRGCCTMNNVTCVDTWLHVGRYVYTLEQMVATEQDILSTLDWHVVPPVFADYGILISTTSMTIGQSPLLMMMHPLTPIELEDEPPEVVQAQ